MKIGKGTDYIATGWIQFKVLTTLPLKFGEDIRFINIEKIVTSLVQQLRKKNVRKKCATKY